MKRLPILLALTLSILVAGCAPAAVPPAATDPATEVPPTTVPPTRTPVLPPPTFTPFPTFTLVPAPVQKPSKTPAPPFDLDSGGWNLVLDFTARLCEAVWMNGVETGLPCPGDLNDPSHGYAGLLSGTDQGMPADFAMVMLLPAQPSSNTAAIFGRYPAVFVGSFDRFKTSLTCRSDVPCNVEFTLGYYDANGTYHEDFPKVSYKQGDAPVNYTVEVGKLGGQMIEFVLVIRNNGGDPASAWALLVAPRLLNP